MNNIVLFEDGYIRNMSPFIYSRYTGDIYIGGLTNLERIKNIIHLEEIIDKIYVECREHLKEYVMRDLEVSLYEYKFNDEFIGLNSLLCEPLDTIINMIKLLAASNNTVFISRGRIIGFNASKDNVDILLEEAKRGKIRKKIISEASIKIKEIKAELITFPWDIIYSMDRLITREAPLYARIMQLSENRKSGKHRLYSSEKLSSDKIFVDCSRGPIVIESDVDIHPYSILRGPLWIKDGAKILSTKVIGPAVVGRVSKIGAELDYSLLDDFSNMAHSGFLGHSYVGRWVNVGAGTVFSDLKNTYGLVKMNINGSVISSGKIKLGAFISDYAKIAIGTMIYSGKWVGISSHVYNIVDRDVPSFTIWRKNNFEELRIEKAIDIQSRMFNRRGIKQRNYHIKLLKYLFEITKNDRANLINS